MTQVLLAENERAWGWALVAIALLTCAACGDPPDDAPPPPPRPDAHAEKTPLIDHTLWVEVSAGDDPFVEHRPDVVDCHPAASSVEDLALEVLTDDCNYYTVSQPAATHINKGETLTVIMWSLALFSEEPAQAHVAMMAGEHLVWEKFIDVPGPSATYTPKIEATFDLDEGEPIVFHLHNHGVNSWYLLNFVVGPD